MPLGQLTVIPPAPYSPSGAEQIGPMLAQIGASIRQARTERRQKEEQSFQIGLALAMQGVPVDYDALGKQAEKLYAIKFEKKPEMAQVGGDTRSGISGPLPTGRMVHPLESFAQEAQEKRALQSALSRNQTKIAELTGKALEGDSQALDVLRKTGILQYPDVQASAYHGLTPEQRDRFVRTKMLGEMSPEEANTQASKLAQEWIEQGRYTDPNEARQAAANFIQGKSIPKMQKGFASSLMEAELMQKLVGLGLPATIAFEGAQELAETGSMKGLVKKLGPGFKTAIERQLAMQGEQLGLSREGLNLQRGQLNLETIKTEFLIDKSALEGITELRKIEQLAKTKGKEQALDVLKEFAVLKKAGVDIPAEVEEQASIALAEQLGLEVSRSRSLFQQVHKLQQELISFGMFSDRMIENMQGPPSGSLQFRPGKEVQAEVDAALKGKPTQSQEDESRWVEVYKRFKQRIQQMRKKPA